MNARLRCGVTMKSKDNPGHIHVCDDEHPTGEDHRCVDPECHRRFYPRTTHD